MAANSRNSCFHRSGGQKLKIKVLAGLVPSGGSEGESVACLSPGFWWLRAILASSLGCQLIPVISASAFFTLPSCVCLCVSFSVSYKDLWPTLIQYDLMLILNELHL